MAIVWLYNLRRGTQLDDPPGRLFHWFGSPRHWLIYVLFCAVVGVLLVRSLPWLTRGAELWGIPDPWLIALVVAMTLNFHHYALDAVIWRRRKA
jgi:hypothetical protein